MTSMRGPRTALSHEQQSLLVTSMRDPRAALSHEQQLLLVTSMRDPRTALSHEHQDINLARKLHYFYSWIQPDGETPNSEMLPLCTGQRIGKAPKKCYAIFTKIVTLLLSFERYGVSLLSHLG